MEVSMKEILRNFKEMEKALLPIHISQDMKVNGNLIRNMVLDIYLKIKTKFMNNYGTKVS